MSDHQLKLERAIGTNLLDLKLCVELYERERERERERVSFELQLIGLKSIS